MKIKYLFLSLLAAAAFATACEEEAVISSLESFKVDSSYIGFSPEGGSQTIKAEATTAWSIDTTGTTKWLNVSPVSGGAGTSEITFTTLGTGAHSAELYVTVGENTQIITVKQVGGEVPVSTIAEVLNGSDGATYRVGGTVSSIASTTYGNLYIEEDGKSLYIYGVKNSQGQYPSAASGGWASFGIDAGDYIVVEGPRTTYGSTIELVDATVISVKKSLIKVIPDAVSVNSNDTTFVAKIVNTGDKLNVTTDASWVGAVSYDEQADTTYVTFHVAENVEHTSRTATITYTGSTSKASSSVSTTVTQGAAPMSASEGGSGTFADPYTVAGIVANISTIPATDSVYVKGKVSSVKYTFSESFGTATFNISEDGSTDGPQFTAYSVLFFHGNAWKEGCTQIKVGDEVVIYGLVTLYNNLAQSSSKKAYVQTLNGATSEAAAPYTVAQVKKYISEYVNAHPEMTNPTCPDDVYVKGIISSVKYTFSASFGTSTFNISADGTAEAEQFTAYSLLYFGSKSWAEGNKQVNVGDSVVIYGKVMNYNGTYETASKKACLYSLNGETE